MNANGQNHQGTPPERETSPAVNRNFLASLVARELRPGMTVVENLHVGGIGDKLAKKIADPKTAIIVIELAGYTPELESMLNQFSQISRFDPLDLEDDLLTLFPDDGATSASYLRNLTRAITGSGKHILFIDDAAGPNGESPHFEQAQTSNRVTRDIATRPLETPRSVESLVLGYFDAHMLGAQESNSREDRMLTNLVAKETRITRELIRYSIAHKINDPEVVFIIGGQHKRFEDILQEELDPTGIKVVPETDTGNPLEYGPMDEVVLLAKAGRLDPKEHGELIAQAYLNALLQTLLNPNNPSALLHLKQLTSREQAGLHYGFISDLARSFTIDDIAGILDRWSVEPLTTILHDEIEFRVLPLEGRRKQQDDAYEHLRERYRQIKAA